MLPNASESTSSGNLPTTFEQAYDADRVATIQLLGNAFHELWQRGQTYNEDGSIRANGERTVKLKSTKDEEWSAENGGAEQVDISNTGFVRLPEDWQKENVDAAEVIVDLIKSMGGAENIDLTDPEVYKKAGDAIHTAWLHRPNNAYAKGSDLDVPFEELPLDEQEKDLVQLRFALELLKPDENVDKARIFGTRVLKIVNNWALEKHLPMRSVNGDLIMPGTLYYEDQYDALASGRR